MKIEDVVERFILMTDLNSDRAAKYQPLCEDAMAEIDRRTMQDDPAAQTILCAAAAALALYRWALMTASTEIGSFSAGDVKITKSSTSVAMAKEVWAEAAAAPYLKDSGFLFERIQK